MTMEYYFSFICFTKRLCILISNLVLPSVGYCSRFLCGLQMETNEKLQLEQIASYMVVFYEETL